MMLAGVVMWLVAQGPVMLGYDEGFVGLTREQLEVANDRMLPFMEHDRATLAGVMIALGALYPGLAHERGEPLEWLALRTSAALGFGWFASTSATATSTRCTLGSRCSRTHVRR